MTATRRVSNSNKLGPSRNMGLQQRHKRKSPCIRKPLEGPRSNKTRKILTFIGLILINLPLGVLWYIGNLMSYTNSYIMAKFGPEAQRGTMLLIATFICTWSLGNVLFGKVSMYVNKHILLELGLVAFTVIMSACYFAIQYSPLSLIVTLGIFGGLCMGLFQSIYFLYLVTWTTGRDVGLVTGVITQTAIGAIGVNQLITMYINPENVAPDLETAATKYFSQPELLQRVPSVFLVMACAFFIVQQVGFLMLMEPNDVRKELDSSDKEDTESLQGLLDETDAPQAHLVNGSPGIESDSSDDFTDSRLSDILSYPLPNKHSPQTGRDGNQGQNEMILDETTDSAGDSENEHNILKCEEVEIKSEPGTKWEKSDFYCGDLTPTQMLRTKEFYILWIIYACCEMGLAIVVTVYKLFGQRMIGDDHFLRALATTLTLCMVLGRICWGLFSDRFGFKTSIIVELSCGSLFAYFIYFTPRLNRWVYFLCTCALFVFLNGMYGNMTVAGYKFFGKSQFSAKAALLSTSTIAVSIFSTALYDTILTYLGWFWLFCSVGIIQHSALILAVAFIPDGI